MVKPHDRLRECIGFNWDDGNVTKNWETHDVSESECEQVFFNRPLIARRDTGHSEIEARFYVLGRTDSSRLLFVAFTIRHDKVRVISARDMTRAEKQRYQQ
jgi:uncharacterized DUF497 family protein